jgi:hypothetical protein
MRSMSLCSRNTLWCLLEYPLKSKDFVVTRGLGSLGGRRHLAGGCPRIGQTPRDRTLVVRQTQG